MCDAVIRTTVPGMWYVRVPCVRVSRVSLVSVLL